MTNDFITTTIYFSNTFR